MTRLPYLLVLTLAIPLGAGVTTAGEPPATALEECPAGTSCPQTSPGWMLYLDPNRVPDFWWRGEVSVREISICEHGIHFFFVEEQAGQPFLMALILMKPSEELVEKKLRTRGENRPVREKLDLDLKAYFLLIEELKRVSMGALSEAPQVTFLDSEARDRPTFVPWRLTLRWQGVEIEMKGYLDLYINMMS